MYLFPLEPEVVAVARVSVEQIDRKRGNEIREVFAYWRKYHNQFQQPTSKMNEWVKIRLRLSEGYSVAQLCRAIDGMHASPWHCGENPGGKKYLSLELCMRDAGKIEQFLELASQRSGPVLSEKTQRTLRAAERWADREADDDQS